MDALVRITQQVGGCGKQNNGSEDVTSLSPEPVTMFPFMANGTFQI